MDAQAVIPALKTKLLCIAEHVDGEFDRNRVYKVNAYQWVGEQIVSVRVRDNFRQRKDFNFNPKSKNYIWNYFTLVEEETA